MGKRREQKGELLGVFKIFANNHRLLILKLLKEKGEKSVGQVASCLEIPFNTVSKNVLYLADKGILSRRYDTPFVLYKISNSAPEAAKIIISKLL